MFALLFHFHFYFYFRTLHYTFYLLNRPSFHFVAVLSSLLGCIYHLVISFRPEAEDDRRLLQSAQGAEECLAGGDQEGVSIHHYWYCEDQLILFPSLFGPGTASWH